MNWYITSRANDSARLLADRHYSRVKPGSQQFAPPGRCLVLTTHDFTALWVTSWQYPEYTAHQWKGAWYCSMFRNESDILSSELIVEAVSATQYHFGQPPDIGMITFVNPDKIKSVNPGYCFKKAGFRRVGETKRKLVVLQLLPEAMPDPTAPIGAYKKLPFSLN